MRKKVLLKELIIVIDDVKKLFNKRRIVSVIEKSQGNYLTSLDIEVEEYLRKRLNELLPSAGIIAEESTAIIKNKNWVIDPIDGTGNFINGFPFTVSIALINNKNETEIGAVYCHSTDELFYSASGCGAFLRKGIKTRRIRVKQFAEKEGIIIFGVPYDREKTHKILSIVEKMYSNASDIKRIGPSSLDICRVAEGKAKMYFELDLKRWDYAAGELILKEAGGYCEEVGDLRVFKATP